MVMLFFTSQEETGRTGRRAAQKGESKMGERQLGFFAVTASESSSYEDTIDILVTVDKHII